MYNSEEFEIVTDNDIIDGQAHEYRFYMMDQITKDKLKKYQNGEYEIEFSPEDYRFHSFEQLEQFSIENIIHFNYNSSNVVKSFTVIWRPTWIYSIFAKTFSELLTAYWTHVLTGEDLLDMCPYNDSLKHNVRRVLDHRFILHKNTRVINPIYLLQWSLENVTLKLFNSKHYSKYAKIVKEFILQNDIKEFNPNSRKKWFITKS
ncbi:hypothetical protein RDWZM_010430 [Blomia tropicalis]|uniref:Uncharacterized protein n=1 Tax=Blomia tropicalis TaxID=40697 RepID=A0A9Q0M1V8_BLOTA|nr:hypothetical protein RDWZM_010430 [Blomia tropicalis]